MDQSRSPAAAGDVAVIDHLMAGGEMLASQLRSPTSWSPEKRLAAAVLTSALISIRDRHGDPAHRHAVDEDLAWVMSDDVTQPFCFLRLCDVFGLDPAWVREVAERWRQAGVRGSRRPFSLHRHAA